MYGHPLQPKPLVAALRSRHVAVAACVAELAAGDPPTEILLIPAGMFRARDGRPKGLPGWRLTPERAREIIRDAESARGDLVIDYEHQTLAAEENGKPAPAAGWFRRMQWRDGEGLVAVDVRWSTRAAEYIRAGEYRYISPVFEYDRQTGEVTAILMAAVTNFPAIDGHSDLAVRAAARFSTQETTMDRNELIAALGLSADATDAQITAALTAGREAVTALTALRAELGVDENGDPKATVADLKAARKPDLSQYVPKAVHDETRAQLAALRANGESAEVDRLIEAGLEDGRIPGQATADWLRQRGLAALKAHLADAPTLEALKGTQTQGKRPQDDDKDGLSAEEQAVCKATGMTVEAFKAAKKTD